MKRILTLIMCAAVLAGAVTGCKTQLESGGAYAPVAPDGSVVIAPDKGFAITEISFKLAHQAVRTVFDFEMENRALLWSISPKIKHTLDEIRPQINDAILIYATARDAYLANPTPAMLGHLEFALSKIQQLATAAQAVIPKE